MSNLKKSFLGLFIAVISLTSFANNQSADDQAITERVQANIADLPANTISHTNLKGVTLSTKNAVVSVVGTLDQMVSITTLVRVIQSTPGVEDVDITQLKAPREQAFNDAIITAKITGLLQRENINKNVQFQTNAGYVSMWDASNNTVSDAEMKKAMALAKTVPGVTAVEGVDPAE